MTIGYLMRRLKVSRTRAYQLTRRRNFPVPAGTADHMRIWRKADIDSWLAVHRPDALPEDASGDEGDEADADHP
ncbi:helix-turn-helix domain-containing protein [Frankia sp. CNm7]|uniref:Helix-turn-helix domain-containing protein n=1 Tax=Frankia nepalensis TaxID=1836974 RepID=A0A937US64_9ACTN|nr:helix-turn-helix domain-containing protein [Frankia nepalensis]MBL7515440.1 helix-turn-helix domain-containing protein [Frankia nepalensis]MBL7518398.1 helix-turn-helix domain-containing protein [Frankia nepalensis]MBL7631828.1 helix-turn-helix domain-containing protein [Frankia nepalensis]